MIDVIRSTAALTDDELLSKVRTLARHECAATAQLVAALVELDSRRLYLGQGCSSLFTYCTEVLHLSEHAAYGRIEAARAARKFPAILDLLAHGSLHLTAVGLLSPHLTEDNHATVLDAACHKTKHEIEKLVATLRPAPASATGAGDDSQASDTAVGSCRACGVGDPNRPRRARARRTGDG
jgi:hypothetical protein